MMVTVLVSDPKAERPFSREFKPRSILENPSEETLRALALEHGGVITEFGNLAVTTSTRNRIAKFTEVVMNEIEEDDQSLILQVMDYLKGK